MIREGELLYILAGVCLVVGIVLAKTTEHKNAFFWVALSAYAAIVVVPPVLSLFGG